jgi:hypothetical protein
MIKQKLFEGDADILTLVFWSSVHGVVSLNLAGKLNKRVDSAFVEEAVASAIFRGSASGLPTTQQ